MADGTLRQVGPDTGAARLYACGITPYDAAHLGHAFTYVCVDLLHRAWLDADLGVVYAQNVTDVDDPLLERAAATSVDWRALAQAQTEVFRHDMSALAVLPPTALAGVVESLDDVVAMVERLAEVGRAYRVGTPDENGQGADDWYFAFDESAAGLGAGDDLIALFAERGGDPDRRGKRHRLDSLLWRAERPGEPAWDTPLGRGRPGWHVECAAIAVKALGSDFDVQAGGRDLAFPHHPMSAQQAEAATGRPFAEAFMHVGMVGLDGVKMSTSLGNLVFVHQLLDDGVDPMAVRLLLLSHHYAADWDYSPALLARSRERLERWRAAFARPAGASAGPVLEAVRSAIGDDLDAPAALAVVDRWSAENGGDADAPRAVAGLVEALLGVR
jgi:L-cysteine:1D-myo-inositol 2-amino-2-deoxy-alpha-D-glucopyranoside ligase